MTIGASAGVITFINTRDPEKARAFYGETLGFKFIADDGFAHVFDLNGTTLRITKIDNHVPQGHPVLGWMVEDIEGTIRRLVARDEARLHAGERGAGARDLIRAIDQERGVGLYGVATYPVEPGHGALPPWTRRRCLDS